MIHHLSATGKKFCADSLCPTPGPIIVRKHDCNNEERDYEPEPLEKRKRWDRAVVGNALGLRRGGDSVRSRAGLVLNSGPLVTSIANPIETDFVALEVLIFYSCMAEASTIGFLKDELLKAAARKREQATRPTQPRPLKPGSKAKSAKSRGEDDSR